MTTSGDASCKDIQFTLTEGQFVEMVVACDVTSGAAPYPARKRSGCPRGNVVVLAGMIAVEPVVRQTPSGDEVTELRVATLL